MTAEVLVLALWAPLPVWFPHLSRDEVLALAARCLQTHEVALRQRDLEG